MKKSSFADILAGVEADRTKRIAKKLPDWAGVEGLSVPSKLALEQCSSSAAARYKAELALRVLEEAVGNGFSACGTTGVPVAGTATDIPLGNDGPATRAGARAASGKAGADGGGCSAGRTDAAGIPLGDDGPAAESGVGVGRRAEAGVVDLTGGLGVDSAAFSKIASRVVYFERNTELFNAVSSNFKLLALSNIDMRNEEVGIETDLPSCDLFYADPARRDGLGKKVFLLEDCTPNILELMPLLRCRARFILLKISPMADISMVATRLGSGLREVHVVSLDGELKELLFLIDTQWTGGWTITLAELSGHPAGPASISGDQPHHLTDPAPALESSSQPRTNDDSHTFSCRRADAFPTHETHETPSQHLTDPAPAPETSFQSRPKVHSIAETQHLDPSDTPKISPRSRTEISTIAETLCLDPSEIAVARPEFATGVKTGEYLIEPGAAMNKSGAFNWVCTRFGLRKLDASTHLYVSAEPIHSPFFKSFRISEVLPFDNATIKDVAHRYPRAELTARNLPLSTDELRRKMKISQGGDTHIFACSTAASGRLLIICTV